VVALVLSDAILEKFYRIFQDVPGQACVLFYDVTVVAAEGKESAEHSLARSCAEAEQRLPMLAWVS
jgi:hypothetical protein